MTPTATYIASENCLQEISNYDPPPDRPDVRFYSSSQQDMYRRHLEAWEIVMQSYNANKTKYEQTLRKIPCDPSCKGLWGDGQKVVEGKDYEVRACCESNCNGVCEQIRATIWAIPLVPVKSEDELWLQAIHYLRNNPALSDNTKVADLKTMFTINKR